MSDDERREVAARLRELCDYCDENEMSLSDDDWPGILSDYIWPEDSGYHIYDDDCRRLADLIEPDHIGDSNKKVDRDALLALADELSGDTLVVPAVYGTYQGGYVAACRDVAHRIREALGVEQHKELPWTFDVVMPGKVLHYAVDGNGEAVGYDPMDGEWDPEDYAGAWVPEGARDRMFEWCIKRALGDARNKLDRVREREEKEVGGGE